MWSKPLNEWVAACNLRERYWLYVVFNCASPHPRLLRIQDPFGKLIVKTKNRYLPKLFPTGFTSIKYANLPTETDYI